MNNLLEIIHFVFLFTEVQMLFRATLRMDQQVRHFPFDCQWLAVTVSLKDLHFGTFILGPCWVEVKVVYGHGNSKI